MVIDDGVVLLVMQWGAYIGLDEGSAGKKVGWGELGSVKDLLGLSDVKVGG